MHKDYIKTIDIKKEDEKNIKRQKRLEYWKKYNYEKRTSLDFKEHKIYTNKEGDSVRKCRKCKKIKKLELFIKRKRNKSGIGPRCLSCVYLYVNKYRKKNKQKVSRWWLKAKAKLKKTGYFQTLEFKEKTRIRSKEYRIKYKNNPIFKLSKILRERIRGALKSGYESGSVIKLIGCSIKYARLYLESLFKPGMNWKNHGSGIDKWHIDHIIPCRAFDLENINEQKKCFHYSNLQPLWESENLSKNDKLPDGTRARDVRKNYSKMAGL